LSEIGLVNRSANYFFFTGFYFFTLKTSASSKWRPPRKRLVVNQSPVTRSKDNEPPKPLDALTSEAENRVTDVLLNLMTSSLLV